MPKRQLFGLKHKRRTQDEYSSDIQPPASEPTDPAAAQSAQIPQAPDLQRPGRLQADRRPLHQCKYCCSGKRKHLETGQCVRRMLPKSPLKKGTGDWAPKAKVLRCHHRHALRGGGGGYVSGEGLTLVLTC